jgi:hypothetical protein
LQLVAARQFLAARRARRTSARSRNATADAEVLVTVTVVARSDLAGPAFQVVAAVAETREAGSVRSDCRFAY